MRSDDRSPWPQRTTMVAGVLLLISGVLLLLESARASLPVTEVHVIPLSGPPVLLAAGLIRAAGYVVAAVGIAGEVGIAARSILGRVALVVWGLRDLTTAVLALVPVDAAAPSQAVVNLSGLLPDVCAAAGLVAAIQVVRARVLSGVARWVLLPVVLVDVAFIAVQHLPAPAALAVLGLLNGLPLEFLRPVLTLVVAAALLLWGRTEAVKHRARVIHDAW